MLMRSEANTVDCEDPVVALACLDPEADMYKECPAACREDASDTEDGKVVKSGELDVSVNENKGADAFLYGGVSDLDTISFKASEDGVSVTKVTLERYGYSSSNDVASVWLEDENGTRITDPKELNSKDQVTLSIYKDHRVLDENDTMTIVLQTAETYASGDNAGSSIGFKVIGIETSAADVNGVNPKGNPYLYDLVSYDGSAVTLTYKGKNDTYHIGEGPYEVFRFKLKAAPTSAALVRGFTITNVSTGKHLDLEDFLKDVKVSVNDEELKNVTYTIDDDELSINFDEVEIEAKATSIFAVNIELADDFDELESKVLFTLAESTDIKVTEKKTWARVSVNGWEPAATAEYSFNGSKITLSNAKLGTVSMPAGAEDVAIAEWTIDLGGQSLVVAANTIAVVANNTGIDALRLVVDGEEFDAKCEKGSTNTTCTFNKKFTIEKDGKLQIVVDINDDATPDSTVEFQIAGKSLFGKTSIGTTDGYVNGLTYEDSKDKVLAADFVGSVTLYNLKVTAAKASLENTLTKAQEFKENKTTSDVTVFEGTYKAKKQDITLTDVYYTPGKALQDEDDSVTLKLYIDGKLVSSTDIDSTDGTNEINDSVTRVKVAAGESVKVEVKADVYAVSTGNTYSYKVELRGEDADGNDAGKGSDYTVDMKFVSQGSADVEAISNSTHKQKDVLLRASNLPIAAFKVSASNGTVDFETMKFTLIKGTEAMCNTVADAKSEAECVDLKYTEEEANAYNAQLSGAVKSGDVKTDFEWQVQDEEWHCVNKATNTEDSSKTMETCVDELYDEAGANTYNANLGDAVAAGATKLQAKWTDASTGAVAEDAIRIKVNGQDVEEEDIKWDNGVFTITEIGEEDIDKNGVEVVVSLKGNADAAPYTLTLDEVNDEDKNIVFKKNVVPALLTIEQKNGNGVTEFKFSVDKYESSNTVSDVCFYKSGTNLGCLNENISNGSVLEIEGGDSVQLVDRITYEVNGLSAPVEIRKADFNDYFKVNDGYLKVYKAD